MWLEFFDSKLGKSKRQIKENSIHRNIGNFFLELKIYSFPKWITTLKRPS